MGYNAGSENVLEWARDRASTNEAAVTPLLIIFPLSLNGPCFSHTGNNTLEKMHTPDLGTFSELASRLKRAPIAQHEWRTLPDAVNGRKGTYPRPGGTRWVSTQENWRYIRSNFNDLRQFFAATTSDSVFKERGLPVLGVSRQHYQHLVCKFCSGALRGPR